MLSNYHVPDETAETCLDSTDAPLLHHLRRGTAPRRLAAHGGELDPGPPPEGASDARRAPAHRGGGPGRLHAPARHPGARRALERRARAAEGARHRRGG